MATTRNRRRRKRQDSDGEPEFQVAPMVDVLLVLMLFFMSITSTEVLKKEKNLVLADAKNGKEDKDRKKHEVVINVSWEPGPKVAAFILNQQAYPSAAALKPVLSAQRQRDPQAFVLIRSDKDVEYTNLSDLMGACAGVGISSVAFAVKTGAKAEKAPAPAP